MNGKPKNWKALVDSVSYANHPEIDAVDKCLLNCLANSGSALGIGCRPGNAALMAASTRKWSATHERMNKLERLGLIKCTEKVHGRPNTGFNPTTKASVFQILYRHPAYPDYSPNGRSCYLKKHPDEPDDSPKKHPVKPDDSAENIRPKAEKHPVTEPKTSGTDTENIRPIDRMTSYAHPQSIPTTSPPNGGGGTLGQLPEEMEGQPLGKRAGELESWITEYGGEVVTRAVRRWVDRRGIPVAGMTKKPRWYAFLDEGLDHIKAIAREMDAERRANDPVLKAAQEKRQRDFETQAGGLLDGMKDRPDEGPAITDLSELD